MSGTIGVVGVGLIGGSIGLSAGRRGAYVVGMDRDPLALEAALTLGAIAEVVEGEELHRVADVVVIATHLENTLKELERLGRERSAAQATLVLDVSSVKVPVVYAARDLKNFVATHPMAGTERSGVLAARADLFDGAPWAYVPTGDERLDESACKFIRLCGGFPVAVGAEEHDRTVALTSHLPQIVASCYVPMLVEREPFARQLCGPVARELLRIADMNPAMWSAILESNAHNIAPQLRRLASKLQSAADAMLSSGSDRYAEVSVNR